MMNEFEELFELYFQFLFHADLYLNTFFHNRTEWPVQGFRHWLVGDDF